MLTHWGPVTHICVSKLTFIGSDNGLSPGWRLGIIWTNAGILLNGPLVTNFSEILSDIHTISFKKMHFEMSPGKWWPFCLSLHVLHRYITNQLLRNEIAHDCSGSAGASVVAHGVALPLYRDCFLDLRLFNSPDLRRLVLCYCCQAWTLETVLGGNTALTRWWTARSIDADAKR